uniref:Uncharacterized mitochondrial protein AtMg00240-like n=1 Tax=Nicotiana tabacum TaxID=4097 RepID=A0A1S3Z8J4_TOBAC|nr:PREDICTED: uncharacterized mitochondrial protein AtMg00240-like [Nicotiana tabacum]
MWTAASIENEETSQGPDSLCFPDSSTKVNCAQLEGDYHRNPKMHYWVSSLSHRIRPDIVFSVGLCAMFQSNLKESHLKAAKRILRYLKGTQELVLYYALGDSFNLIGYPDADYASYLVDMKSTSGMTHFLGLTLGAQGSKIQWLFQQLK